ncbi:MAG: SGNH/GDSL hydrolase family protein [Rhodanobacteraceae bacterium]|nr:SGNH/GDSL hydrolase family protein [Rhodanobacteraceae bacterium]
MSAPPYLALGDSYTIGEGVPASGRWPAQLATRLGWAAPTIVAQTGWTTDELALAIDAAGLASVYDRVSLLIGVNNQYRGRTVANYAAEFRVLLDRSVALAGGDAKRAFVVSIPDWGVTAFAARDGRGRTRIGRDIDAFNAAARAVSEARGVRYIDITPTSRDRGGDRDMLADDGLHPSAAMYTRWVDDIVHTLPVAGPG